MPKNTKKTQAATPLGISGPPVRVWKEPTLNGRKNDHLGHEIDAARTILRRFPRPPLVEERREKGGLSAILVTVRTGKSKRSAMDRPEWPSKASCVISGSNCALRCFQLDFRLTLAAVAGLPAGA